jgi:hypothetical protein
MDEEGPVGASEDVFPHDDFVPLPFSRLQQRTSEIAR